MLSRKRTVRDNADDDSSQPGGERPFKRTKACFDCDMCTQTFTENKSLRRHCRTAHWQQLGLQSVRVACTYCAKWFAREDTRKRHEREKHLDIKRGGLIPEDLTMDDTVLPSEPCLVHPTAVDLRGHGTQHTPLSHSYAERCAEALRLTPFLEDIFGGDDAQLESSEGLISFPKCPSLFDSPRLLDDSEFLELCDFFDAGHEVLSEGSTTPRPYEPPGSWTLFRQPYARRFNVPVTLIKSRLLALSTNRFPTICTLCLQPFGQADAELHGHIQKHLKEYEELADHFICNICEIRFQHEADLRMHERSATLGSCGFQCGYSESCKGHHPPSQDGDRSQLAYRILHWEHAQLSFFMEQVENIASSLRPLRHTLSMDSLSVLFENGLTLNEDAACSVCWEE